MGALFKVAFAYKGKKKKKKFTLGFENDIFKKNLKRLNQ